MAATAPRRSPAAWPRYLDTNSRFVAGVAKQFAGKVPTAPAIPTPPSRPDRAAHRSDVMIDA